ncbi:hypothetical protein BJ878DRAFT_525275 [Calycina marina]|uniref:Secreted protein n=1 Tax=Calycina marina TaxID=1763456 RepID=A0A9P8CB71_9HELO|nr:hypothetical protein BJ878DRAFT_525275 [Calycina marina]
MLLRWTSSLGTLVLSALSVLGFLVSVAHQQRRHRVCRSGRVCLISDEYWDIRKSTLGDDGVFSLALLYGEW